MAICFPVSFNDGGVMLDSGRTKEYIAPLFFVDMQCMMNPVSAGYFEMNLAYYS
jgi:hypothetical protein